MVSNGFLHLHILPYLVICPSPILCHPSLASFLPTTTTFFCFLITCIHLSGHRAFIWMLTMFYMIVVMIHNSVTKS